MTRYLEVCLSPVGTATILLFAGSVLIAVRRRSPWGARLLAAGSVAYLVMLFSPVAEILIRGLERGYPALLEPDSAAGLSRVVVLSGYGEDNEGIPVTSNLSEQTVFSLVEGMRLYHKLPGSKLVLSGGALRDGDRPIASIMADFVTQLGVPPQDVIVEGKSQSTWENLSEVRKIVGESPFVLVAAACDLRRAVAVARRLGLRPVPAPSYIWAMQHFPENSPAYYSALWKSFAYPSIERLYRVQWAWHEYLGYVWYKLLGRI
jgi:uncharacterized SAM-binding protein YcdF (DUF218 family)